MNEKRLFLDTVFIQALLNKQDDYHARAVEMLPLVRGAREVHVTEAVLMEVGNALSSFDRKRVANFIGELYRTNNTRVISIDRELFKSGLTLYESRLDKTWGLVDCISFRVMERQGLSDAVTSDKHFVQAGFRALMLSVEP